MPWEFEPELCRWEGHRMTTVQKGQLFFDVFRCPYFFLLLFLCDFLIMERMNEPIQPIATANNPKRSRIVIVV